jgi:hypothetical protein
MEDVGMFWRFALLILRPFGIFYGHLVYFMSILLYFMAIWLFYCHLVYFMAIWYILWPFGIIFGDFFPFWYVVPRKIWQPCWARESFVC